MGVRDFDASVGGCGGCNFAPGSKGNVSIESLWRALEQVEPGEEMPTRELLEANVFLAKALGRPLEQY